jgi:hypothetical protein
MERADCQALADEHTGREPGEPKSTASPVAQRPGDEPGEVEGTVPAPAMPAGVVDAELLDNSSDAQRSVRELYLLLPQAYVHVDGDDVLLKSITDTLDLLRERVTA